MECLNGYADVLSPNLIIIETKHTQSIKLTFDIYLIINFRKISQTYGKIISN